MAAVKQPTAKQLYKLKNDLLEERGFKRVSQASFYRDMFPEGSLGVRGCPEVRRPNMIYTVVEKNDGDKPHGRNWIVFDDMEALQYANSAEFAVSAPITYRGRNRTAENAHQLWGFCIDLDGVGLDQLRDLLHQIRNDYLPIPTYLVNSGNGFHVYYLLEEPVPLYKYLHEPLNRLKMGLTRIVWNQFTSTIGPDKRQFQGIFQGFRMPGSCSKLGKRYQVVAFQIGNKVSLETLSKFVFDEYKINLADLEASRTSLAEAKEMYPAWYEEVIINGNKTKHKWDIAGKVHGDNPYALYDWWIKKIHQGAFDGNRYNCIATLMTYGVKCDVDRGKVLNDALELVPELNGRTENKGNNFTEQDVYDAYTFYSESYATYSINAIEAKTKIRIERNKRNGRKQNDHLRRARAVQREDYPNGEWRNKNGRPIGSGTAKEKVSAYRAEHPEETVTEVSRALKLSRPTVYKWWDA